MYKEIRKYSFFWSVFLHYLGIIYTKAEIKQHIEQRLMLNSSSDEINMFIVDTVDKNSDTGIGLYDTIHHMRSKIDEYMFHLEI